MKPSALVALALAACTPVGPGTGEPQLVWSEDFDGPAGAPPDSAHWSFDLGNRDGWGNRESQIYTARPDNVALDGQGNLVITARRETLEGFSYTSGRLNSRNKQEITYGRIEARIQLPLGKGLWPAFWLMGNDVATAGWPDCGEIDVMENRGASPTVVSGALHGPGYSGGNALTDLYRHPQGLSFADGFHTYAIEWRESEIRWLVDDQLFHSVRSTRLRADARWVFDHPFFIILNVAVGGTFGGEPDGTTPFPQAMRIDHVRVFALNPR